MTSSEDENFNDDVSTANLNGSTPFLLQSKAAAKRSNDIDKATRTAICSTIITHLNGNCSYHGLLASIARQHGVSKAAVTMLKKKIKQDSEYWTVHIARRLRREP